MWTDFYMSVVFILHCNVCKKLLNLHKNIKSLHLLVELLTDMYTGVVHVPPLLSGLWYQEITCIKQTYVHHIQWLKWWPALGWPEIFFWVSKKSVTGPNGIMVAQTFCDILFMKKRHQISLYINRFQINCFLSITLTFILSLVSRGLGGGVCSSR